MTDQEILEKIVCKDIPDTRKLQQLRIDSLNTVSSYEEYIRKYSPDKDKNTPRLVKIPSQELEKVYRGSIPLSFPMLDTNGRGETDFFRWQNASFQKGAMHLTTEKALENLLRIFVSNQIPMQEEVAYGKVFDAEGEKRVGVSVPHSWYVNFYDPYECLFIHQFVVCKQKVIGTPYYFSEEIITGETKQEEGYNHASLTISKKRTERKTYYCKAVFSNPTHRGNDAPKNYLSKMLEDRRKKTSDDWDESARRSKLENIEIELLKIGEPILIYDPSWVKN